MKNLRLKIAGLLGLAILAALVFAGGTFDGLGPSFTDTTRTNTWTWASVGLAPTMTILGSNYVAISSNRTFLSGTGITNTLQIVNGLVVGIN